MTSRLWRFLTTDIAELVSGETVNNTVETPKTVFELADVLAQEGLKVAELSIGTGLLKFYCCGSLCAPGNQAVGPEGGGDRE